MLVFLFYQDGLFKPTSTPGFCLRFISEVLFLPNNKRIATGACIGDATISHAGFQHHVRMWLAA